MEKVSSSAYYNAQQRTSYGPYSQYGPPSQATQLTHDTTRNQQPGTTNNVCHYRAANRVVQPLQSAHFTFHNVTGTSDWQTSAVPHQAIPYSSSNTQNPNSQMIYGFNVATPHDFHQNSAQNSSTRSPSNMMNANTKYIQQDASANWNRSVKENWKQLARTQNGNVVPDLQHCSVQRNFYQNVNRELTNPAVAFTTTSTPLPPVQVVGNSALVSASAFNIQTSPNQHHRQNSTQHGFPPSRIPPSYASVCQSYRNKNLPSSGIIFPSSQNTQQYSNQFNSTPNNGEAATSSFNSNMHARFANSLCKSFTAGSDGLPPVCASSLHNSTMAPALSSVIESHNLNASKSSSLHSGQTTYHVISAMQHAVDELPQLMQQPESISAQRNNTHSYEANNHEISEMLTSVNPNDSSVHSSPGRTGSRAIAVVQPLTQKYHPVATRHTSSKTINHECTATGHSPSNQEKLFISPDESKSQNDKDAYLREVSKPLKDDCTFPPRNTNQVKSNQPAIGNLVAFNDDAVVSSPDSAGPQQSLKRLRADYMGSEPAINIQLDQIDALAAKRLVTSKVPECQNGDEDKSEMPPDEEACIYDLTSLPTTSWTVMQIITLLQKAENIQKINSEGLSGFCTARQLLSKYWDGDCKKLSDKLKTGWYKDLIIDVQEFCRKHLNTDSVILSQVKHSFVQHLQSFHVITDDEVYSEPPYRSSWLNTNEQLDDIDKEFGFPLTLKHCSHTVDGDCQLGQVETVNSIPAQNVSEVQNKASSQTEFEAVDSESTDSSDPYYKFEIEILPPEEAKLIFEQIQSTKPVIQLEKGTNSPAENDLPEVIDVTIGDSKLEKAAVTPLEQICCIARWKQIIIGSNTPSLSTCQCTKEQSHGDCTDKTLDEQEMAAQKNDSKFRSAMVRENRTKSGENIIDQIQTFSWPEICNEANQTIDFTGNDDKPYSDKGPNNISLLSRNSSQSRIIFTSENKDEDPNQMPDVEENREQAHLKCTESSQKIDSHTSDVMESSLKTEEVQMQTSATVVSQTFSRKHGPSSQKPLEGVSKCRKVFVDSADSKPLASRNVKLVLFGSATKGKCVSVGGHKSYRSMPPKVLSVSFSPPGETVPTGKYSAKQLIYKKWRKSFPLTRIKPRTKLNTQTCTLSGVSLKKAERSVPANTEELPVSSQMRTCNRNPKRCLSPKRKRVLSYGLKLEEQKTKKLKQPAAHERSKAENRSKAFVSLQENSVLRFSVLPNTFSFKDASNATKDTPEHVSDKADLVEANDNSPNIPAKRAKGEWFPNPKKRYIPRHQSPVLEASTVFHEYQKKYRKKMQPSLDA